MNGRSFLLLLLYMSIAVFPPFTVHSENVEHVCSQYHFDFRYVNWEEASQYCKRRNYDGLVSMQTEEEWGYFKNITTNITSDQQRALKRRRWFIGLRYFSHKWCWSSDTKACKNQPNGTGNWRWNAGEPNNLHAEHCVEMFHGGIYGNINCGERFSSIGFICEKKKLVCKVTLNNFS